MPLFNNILINALCSFLDVTLQTLYLLGYVVCYVGRMHATVGDQLGCAREPGNCQDTFAVAIIKDDVTVGHVPRSILPVCSIFIRQGGMMSIGLLAIGDTMQIYPKEELKFLVH